MLGQTKIQSTYCLNFPRLGLTAFYISKAFWMAIEAGSWAATENEGQAMMVAAEGEDDSGLVGLPVVEAGSWV